jgi:hypothetical protein
MVTESVMTLDAILANVIAQKAEVILQAKVDQLDLDDKVQAAVDDFNTDSHFEKAIENFTDSYDFSDAIDEATGNYDFSRAIETVIEESEIEEKVTAEVEKQLGDLRERVVAMVAAVARDEVRKALAELIPAPQPSLWSRLLRRVRG